MLLGDDEAGLVSVARALHRFADGAGRPFIVCDQWLRQATNSAVAAVQAARGGSLCVSRRRLPTDFHWRKMEELVAAGYREAGFEVELTPRSGDGGRDVIATKLGFLSVRILDQVKKYSPNELVPADDVRAIIGVLHADHKASKAVITTTSDFAPRVREDPSIAPFLPTRLELRNGRDLAAWLAEVTVRTP